MKMFNLNARLARRVTGMLAVGLLLGAQTAMACTVGNWSQNSGNLTAGGPNVGVARYSGLCAVETPAGEIAWVQDNSPGGINRIRTRFYVLADNTASAVIYRGFNASSAELFGLSLGTDGTITLSSAGANVSDAGTAGNWNSVEIDWNAGAGSLTLVVNGGTPQTTTFSNANTVASVRLGNLNGAAGSLNFDAYESRRTTEVGRLLVGDVNGNGSITSADVVAARLEFLGTPQSGQIDCNENGSVSSADVVCTRLAFLSSP